MPRFEELIKKPLEEMTDQEVEDLIASCKSTAQFQAAERKLNKSAKKRKSRQPTKKQEERANEFDKLFIK